MRPVVILTLVFLGSWQQFCAQAFYFQNTSHTFYKTTDQSPLHWYIEIFSNENVDTTLRWKVRFESIPAAWDISFDDQTQMHNLINHNDSSDFILQANPSFPQKLILSAALNQTIGSGSVFFAVYNPALLMPDTAEIVFHFFVTQGQLGNDDANIVSLFWQGSVLHFLNEPVDVRVFNKDGRLMETYYSVKRVDLSAILVDNCALIEVSKNNEILCRKFYCINQY